jgi:Xaa-Pro dipeptidase
LGETAAPPRGFPVSEYEERTRAAQRSMAGLGLDALLLTTEAEVRYFSGFLTPFWLSPTRPWFLIVPAAGRPVAVIPTIGATVMEETWISDIRTWPAPRPADDGVTLLAATLFDLVGAEGTVGLPRGHETSLRMPLADFAALQEAAPGLAFHDATQVVRELRMVKSEREIAKLAHACSVVADAFERLPAVVSVGMTEREAFRAFRMALLEAGADEVPYLVGATGPGFESIIRGPGDRAIERGDLLMFDTGSTWDGYWSDFDRYFAFGSATEDAHRAYRTVWEATEAGLAFIEPGVTTSELWAVMAGVITAAGAEESDVGRLGHGVGSQLTEWPSITPDDGTLIRPGMVLTLEPGMTWAPGKTMVHEEEVVVESDGPRLLTLRAPSELPII